MILRIADGLVDLTKCSVCGYLVHTTDIFDLNSTPKVCKWDIMAMNMDKREKIIAQYPDKFPNGIEVLGKKFVDLGKENKQKEKGDKMIHLGQEVKEKVTGFIGIAIARVEYINGCIQYCVKPKMGQDGRMPEGEYIDEKMLTIESDGVWIESGNTGGEMRDKPKDSYRG